MSIDHPKLRRSALHRIADADLLALDGAADKAEQVSLKRLIGARRELNVARRERAGIRRELKRRGLIQRGAK